MYPQTRACQGFPAVHPENVEKSGVLFITTSETRPHQGFAEVRVLENQKCCANDFLGAERYPIAPIELWRLNADHTQR